MSISRRLRYEVLRRDGHACRYCGAVAPAVHLTVDHVIPVALGGSDEPTNLVTACRECNAGKAASAPDAPIVANVADDALRWAAAMERAAFMQAFERSELEWACRSFDETWTRWQSNGEHAPRPEDWQVSVKHWVAAGLDLEALNSLVEDVMPRRNVPFDRLWTYFCGAAWKTLRERQEIARRLLDEETT